MVVVVVGVVGMVVVVVMIVVGAMVVPGLINATGYDDTFKCRQVEQCHASGHYSRCLHACRIKQCHAPGNYLCRLLASKRHK